MSTTPRRIDGIDLSHHQGGVRIDWPAAKAAGVRFVYHKATEGRTVTDDAYTARRREVAAAGLKFGAYHFARADALTAHAEAEHFLDTARPQPGDLVPALDLEVNDHGMTPQQLAGWAHQWIITVRRALGIKRVALYTPFALPGRFAAVLWTPRYSNSNTAPHVPAPFTDWALWQFSDGTYGVPNRVPGVPVACDLNTLRGGPIRRRALLNSLTIPTPKR